MKLVVSKSKNSESFYIMKSVRKDGKSTTVPYKKLGTLEDVKKLAGNQDPYEWAKQEAKRYTKLEKENKLDISITFSSDKELEANKNNLKDVGYLYLQKIYSQLELKKYIDSISSNYRHKYDLNAVLSSMIFSRIIFPASKSASYKAVHNFLDEPNFDLQHVFRSLDILDKEKENIQKHIYEKSLNIIERDTTILYYDCTNFFFEVDEADELKQYGKSKENKPNPIVQMGLFLDGSGIPLAYDLSAGNTNEQKTLKPLEERIIKDFKLSKLVICTDAGLSSKANKKFNNHKNRSYVTVQSIKKMKKHLKEWALDTKGWRLNGSDKVFDLKEIDLTNNTDTFYKERWINENGLEERIIVTFNAKYKIYQETIREAQINRALKKIENNAKIKLTKNQNDPLRFIKITNVTDDGEVAPEQILSLNRERIKEESQYDGFYATATNLEDSAKTIIEINHSRWQIEENFRLMKSEFRSRPVYCSTTSHIEAHFLICFMALFIYRVLEKQIGEGYTAPQIIKTLREIKILKIKNKGYLPAFTRTVLTDKLQELYQITLNTEFITNEQMKKNKKISLSKK